MDNSITVHSNAVSKPLKFPCVECSGRHFCFSSQSVCTCHFHVAALFCSLCSSWQKCHRCDAMRHCLDTVWHKTHSSISPILCHNVGIYLSTFLSNYIFWKLFLSPTRKFAHGNKTGTVYHTMFYKHIHSYIVIHCHTLSYIVICCYFKLFCCHLLSFVVICCHTLSYIHSYIHSVTFIHTYIDRQTDRHRQTYINTHTHIHAYTHTRIHPYIHTFIHPYIHTSVRTYVHTFMFFCTNIAFLLRFFSRLTVLIWVLALSRQECFVTRHHRKIRKQFFRTEVMSRT